MKSRDLIVTALLTPQVLLHWSALEWDLLIRQGRRSHLLARLAYQLKRSDLLDAVPAAPRNHLLSALQMAQRQTVALCWEVECIRKALAQTDARLVLLKGAAYVMANLEVAQGRIFSDVDVLVPKSFLGRCESALLIHGWQGTHHNAYDQHYYRRWMHEIPPMRHVRRGTTIDVHHTILPETARVKVNTAALFTAAMALPGAPNLYTLEPADMLLHSATHLFHEGEFEKGLRDLFDLDSLIRQFGAMPDFWERLMLRASVLGLTRSLYYALRYTTMMLETPVPAHGLAAAEIGKPPAWVVWIMDACYRRVMRPMHASTYSLGTGPARAALYIRSHWVRMPFHLLIFHLGHKALVRPQLAEEKA